MPITTFSSNNNYFSSYIDIKAISTPSNPSSNIGRLFHSSADGKLYFKKSNGDVVDLESGGGGGASAYADLTDVNLTSLANGDVAIYNSSTTDWENAKIANANVSSSAAIAYSKLSLTGSIVNADVSTSAAIVYSKLTLTNSIVNADINSSAAIATSKLADGSSFVTLTGTQTLTNKTLTTPVISTISNTGTLTLPTATTTLVGRDTTDTLTNKTISGASNTFSNINYSTLTGTPPKLDDLSAPDDNTDLNSSTSAHGLLRKLTGGTTNFLREDGAWAAPPGSGGGGGITNISDAGDVTFTSIQDEDIIRYDNDNSEWINGKLVNANIDAAAAIATSKLADGSSFVTLTGSQTLTNKTLTSPVISSVSNTGTVTLPTATTTLVGRDTTDTLTNKTFNADGIGNSITNIENADIKASAGIVYSKLTLTDSVVNADINSAAAIATSKLADSANFLLTTNTKTVTNKTINPTNNTIPFLGTFTYTVYEDSGAIKARNNKTGAVTSNANLDPLITTILASGDPSVEIQTGSYTLHSSFAGWTAISNMRVYFHPGTTITVPQGYSSSVWLFTPTSGRVESTTLEGGFYTEAGTPTFLWNAVNIAPVGSNIAVVRCNFKDIRAEKCNAVINIETNGQSWANENKFINCSVRYSKYGVYFNHIGTYTSGLSGPCHNTFLNFEQQASAASAGTSPQTLGGIIGVLGQYNSFIGCSVWDIATVNAAAPSMTISANAEYTLVMGGVLTHANYSDLGTGTKVFDRWQGLFNSGLSTLSSNALDVLTVKRPVNTASEWGINFDALNNASANKTYALMKAGSGTVTAGAENGYIAFQVMNAGSLQTKLHINQNGNLYIGTSPTRAILDVTSVATSDKTFTFPNATGTLVLETATQTLTNKTLTTPVISTISNTGTITLPTSTDTLVGRATTDTLTNKTISGASNTFSNIPDSALSSNVALENVANTFTEAQTVSKDVLGVLTVKRPTSTLSEFGINFDALSSTSVSRTYAVMKAGMSDATNTSEDAYIAFQVIRAGSLVSRLLINGDGNLYIGASPTRAVLDIQSIATSDKTFTFPNATGTFLIDSATQTATNKTVNLTNNTVTDTSTAAGDLAKSNGTKFVRFARGSADQYLKVNAGGTDLEWATLAGGGDVTTTGTQTLTNKTITAPVFDSYTDYNRIAAPSDPAADKGRIYVKQIDANNDGLFIKVKKAGAYAEVQLA